MEDKRQAMGCFYLLGIRIFSVSSTFDPNALAVFFTLFAAGALLRSQVCGDEFVSLCVTFDPFFGRFRMMLVGGFAWDAVRVSLFSILNSKFCFGLVRRSISMFEFKAK